MSIILVGFIILVVAVTVFFVTKNSPKHAQALVDKSKEELQKLADKAKAEIAKLQKKD